MSGETHALPITLSIKITVWCTNVTEFIILLRTQFITEVFQRSRTLTSYLTLRNRYEIDFFNLTVITPIERPLYFHFFDIMSLNWSIDCMYIKSLWHGLNRLSYSESSLLTKWIRGVIPFSSVSFGLAYCTFTLLLTTCSFLTLIKSVLSWSEVRRRPGLTGGFGAWNVFFIITGLRELRRPRPTTLS